MEENAINISEKNIRGIVKAIDNALNDNKYHDERIWNYLIADIICGNKSKYSAIIFGKEGIIVDDQISVHFEPQPYSP